MSDSLAKLEMDPFRETSKRTLPWLILACLAIVGGLLYSSARLVSLNDEISQKEERLAQLNVEIEKARQAILEGKPAAAARTLSAAVEGDVPESVTTPGASASAPSANLAKLAEVFNGPDRRRVSDALVKQFNETPNAAIVNALAQAVLPLEDPRSYRVNLYVLVTLARMNNWLATASAEQKSVFLRIATSAPLREDPTYRSWADRVRRQLG